MMAKAQQLALHPAGAPQPHEINDLAVCSLFARLPRYHLSAPGTTRQETEMKSARTGTN